MVQSYLKGLQFESEPDYDFLARILELEGPFGDEPYDWERRAALPGCFGVVCCLPEGVISGGVRKGERSICAGASSAACASRGRRTAQADARFPRESAREEAQGGGHPGRQARRPRLRHPRAALHCPPAATPRAITRFPNDQPPVPAAPPAPLRAAWGRGRTRRSGCCWRRWRSGSSSSTTPRRAGRRGRPLRCFFAFSGLDDAWPEAAPLAPAWRLGASRGARADALGPLLSPAQRLAVLFRVSEDICEKGRAGDQRYKVRVPPLALLR